MRIPSLLLAALLPSVIVADQVPLGDRFGEWFEKAKSFIPSAENIDPIDAGAAKVAEQKVQRINIRNWERILAPKLDAEEEWVIYMTGGNKSCFGRCGPVNLVWNESVPLLTALPQTADQPKLKLGTIDCEKDEVLCTAWATGVPSIWHFLLPRKSEPTQAKTPLHIVPLNVTTTTVSDIVSIPSHSEGRYATFDEYEGLLHPIDGLLRKFQLLIPLGWVLWGFGSTPSWLMMIGVSFISRQIMSRRMGNTGSPMPGAPPPPTQQQSGGGAARAPPVPGAAGPASPAGGKAGGKKRK